MDIERSEMFSRREAPRDLDWHLYIVECHTQDLYVGITQDLRKRLDQHNAGRACRYTKFRKPEKLIYSECCRRYRLARQREREVKKFSRAKKLDLSS